MTDKFDICDCMDPETLKIHEEVCAMRRATGICPQLPAIDLMKARIRWLEETMNLKQEERFVCEDTNTYANAAVLTDNDEDI